MSYRVTAPLVLAQDGEGRHVHHYHGSLIRRLPALQAKQLLEKGMVEEIDDPDDDVEDEDDSDDGDDSKHLGADGRPKKVAPKPVWERFRVAQGVVTAEEAHELTKQALIDID